MVMRLLFSLVALVAYVQASSNSLHKRGGWSDVCSYVECSVSFPSPILSGGSMNFGGLDQCLCLSSVSSCVKSNSALSAAASFIGTSTVTDYLNNEVSKNGKTCNYPDHATPKCTPQNPCAFECGDGYTLSGENCVCEDPCTECWGKCGNFGSCPSNSPHKRDVDEWKKDARCDNGYTACGALWSPRSNTEAYECVDVKHDLESCGGCSVPLHRGSPLGTDCTSLPGIAEVSCMSGSCYVHSCMPGYTLASDNSMCMDEETVEMFTKVSKFGWEWLFPVKLD